MQQAAAQLGAAAESSNTIEAEVAAVSPAEIAAQLEAAAESSAQHRWRQQWDNSRCIRGTVSRGSRGATGSSTRRWDAAGSRGAQGWSQCSSCFTSTGRVEIIY